MAYLPRTLATTLRRRLREFPVVLLTGPRQSGKTTLLRHELPQAGYVSLEAPDVRAAARADPRGFLASHRQRTLVLDEVQHAPELLSYAQEAVDRRRRTKGRFVLSGSQNLLLMESVSQSLAGRSAPLTLLPLSLREQQGARTRPPVWERRTPPRPTHPWSREHVWERILRGGYPELVAAPSREPAPWFEAYRQTYLERDVRTLRQVGDLTQFDAFLRLLAARSAALLDLTGLSRDLGVAVNTVKAWLSVLEASWLVVVVRPWATNVRKRMVKSPKVYVLDTGLLCHLVGLRDAEHARQGPMGGAIFETAVLGELVRIAFHRGERPRIHFWRTAAGDEVDFLVEHGDRLVPVEAKATATPTPAHAAPLHALQRDLGSRLLPGYVVHAGAHALPLGNGVLALPLGSL